MDNQYDWKQLSSSITVDPNYFPKSYGLVRRNGKLYYRNYKRALKNGGLSLIDIYEMKLNNYFVDLEKYVIAGCPYTI